MSKEKIDSIEFSSLIPFVAATSIMGSGFAYLYHNAGKSSIISMFFGLLLSMFFVFLIFKVFNVLPEDTLNEKIKKIFPKHLYYVIIIVIIFSLLSLSSLSFFNMVSFFSTQFSSNLSRLSIAVVLSLFVFYAASKNVETISRFSGITIFICLAFFLFNFVSLASDININNILPITNNNWSDIIKSSLVFAVLFSGPSFLLLVIPKANIVDVSKLKKNLIISYVATGIMFLLINLVVLGLLGIDTAKLYTYPIYIVLKKINMLQFANSIENITVLIWFFFLMVSSSLSIIFAKNIFCEAINLFKSKSNKIVSFVISFLIISASLLIFKDPNITSKTSFIFYQVAIYSTFFFLLIIFLVAAKISKKIKK